MRAAILSAFLVVVFSLHTSAQSLRKAMIAASDVSALRFTPDNQYLVMTNGSQAKIYSAGTDTKVKELNGSVNKIRAGHIKDIIDIDFSQSSEYMVSTSADRTIKIWKISSDEVTRTFDKHIEPIIGAKFADHDNLIISVSENGVVYAWNAFTGEVKYSKNDFIKDVRGFDVSSDGKLFAVAGAERKIIIYDASNGSIIQKIESHKNWVRSLAFSPDGKLLASGGDDKVINISEVETGKTIRSIPQKGWIYDLEFSKDGQYIGAALENAQVHFYNSATGTIALKLDDFNSPVFDLSISPDGKEVACHDEFGKGVTFWNIESLHISPVFTHKDLTDKTGPLIMISNPPNIHDNKVIVYKDLLDVRGVVSDESGVRTLKINGLTARVRDNGNFVYNIPLGIGDTYVTIEVEDVNNNISLRKFIVTRKTLDGNEYNPALAKNHLFVVGVDGYQYWPKLNNAVKDVNDLVTVLLSDYNYEFANITVLKNEQATRANIYSALRSLIEKITPQDNLIIYFSGHGYFDEVLSEGYWIPVEAHTNTSGEYISNSEILKIVGTINSQHTFLVADACFSGALFADSRRGFTDNVEKFKSRWGLASGRLEVVSDGSLADKNSPFAKRFLEFLRNNQKEKFTVSELVQYVKTQVAEETNQTPMGNPLKALGDEGGEMVFYKKRN